MNNYWQTIKKKLVKFFTSRIKCTFEKLVPNFSYGHKFHIAFQAVTINTNAWTDAVNQLYDKLFQ